jgi:hypothetical protein
MNVELLKSIQDWLGPIRKQMEATQKTMYQQMLATGSRGGLSGAQIQSLTGSQTSGAALDPDQMRQDLQLKNLFTRIKYANISRGQRDALSSMVRSLAADNRLDDKNMAQIYKMVALIETTGSSKRDGNSIGLGNSERTVQDEMKSVYDQRATKAAQADHLQALQSSFSVKA